MRVPQRIRRRIREFEPDVIYAWVSDSLWAETLCRVLEDVQVPYVIHFMDNHVGIDGHTPLEVSCQEALRNALDRLVPAARVIYTISDSMGRAYQSLWNRPYEVYHGMLDRSGWPWPNPKPEGGADGVFRLAFTGSVEAGQIRGLRDVARACERLTAKGRPARLVLYLTEAYRQRVAPVLGGSSSVEFIAHPDVAGLRAALARADALVLAYGLDRRTADYYRYSFPTKIVPYMLSGRPILAYGPREIEPIAYTLRGGWALTVAGELESALGDDLEDAIVHLMDDAAERERLARAAWEAGVAEHDLRSNAARFTASLLSLAAR